MTDRFRYCVYCEADCTLGLTSPPEDYEPPHAHDCPQVTGLYPVRFEDIPEHGFCCGGCGEDFEVGDVYVYAPVDDPEGELNIVPAAGVTVEIVLCLSCGFAEGT